MVKTYIHTNGLGKQVEIINLKTTPLKRELQKSQAKFRKESLKLKAVCDELNRRQLTLADGSRNVFHATRIIEHSVGKVFGYKTDEEHKRMEAVYQLVVSILSNDKFTEEDRFVALQVLEQGRSRLDN